MCANRMRLWKVIITERSNDVRYKLRAMVYTVMAGCTWDACELAVVEHKHTYHNSHIIEVNVARTKKNVIFDKEM